MNIPTEPFNSDQERIYWGAPSVTPERQAAWLRWVDDYAIDCSLRWIEEVGDDRALDGAAAVIADWSQLDAIEWMPLGPSMTHVRFASGEELHGRDRLNYMLGTRTLETSTEAERVAAVAYQLGISIQQAWKYAGGESSYRGRDLDAAVTTALYRYFDVDGVLLYVGISQNPTSRDEQHARNSAWHRLSEERSVDWYDTRHLAEVAERQAIKAEKPLFNTTHASTYTRRDAIDYLLSRVTTGVKA